jgi:hypothetical protein
MWNMYKILSLYKCDTSIKITVFLQYVVSQKLTDVSQVLIALTMRGVNKCWETSTRQHSIISQKTVIFILAAVRT